MICLTATFGGRRLVLLGKNVRRDMICTKNFLNRHFFECDLLDNIHALGYNKGDIL